MAGDGSLSGDGTHGRWGTLAGGCRAGWWWQAWWVRDGQLLLTLPSPVVELDDDRLAGTGVRLWLKRDDLIHPELPGNKWRKLSPNLAAATVSGHDTLLTFGGAYSNHIRATATAGHYFGFATIGVIRGEQHLPLNPSLAYAVGRGMRLTYLDRATYRAKDDPAVIDRLHRDWGQFYLLPEGGSNELAVAGCAELVAELRDPFDVICCPVGTGATLAGLAAGLRPGQRAIGFSVLKGGQFLADVVSGLQTAALGRPTTNWHIEYGFHSGGYAKTPPDLRAFVACFDRRHQIALDPIYTGKMLLGLFALIAAGAFASGTRIVAVLTG
jgi:1-aminocyclopropane-1-carboxylate deaminase